MFDALHDPLKLVTPVDSNILIFSFDSLQKSVSLIVNLSTN